MNVDEAVRIEILLDLWVSPVDGDAAVKQGLDDLLCRVAGVTLVLEGNRKLAASNPANLVVDRSPQIVSNAASGVYRFPLIQFLEKLDPFRRLVVAVNKITEPIDALPDRAKVSIRNGALGIIPVPPEWYAPMTLIPEAFVGQGVVGFLPIGGDVFTGEEDPDRSRRVSKLFSISYITVEEKIR